MCVCCKCHHVRRSRVSGKNGFGEGCGCSRVHFSAEGLVLLEARSGWLFHSSETL